MLFLPFTKFAYGFVIKHNACYLPFASTWVHPQYLDGIRVTHLVGFL